MKRITRDRRLTPEEVSKYKLIREQIAGELPELIAEHHKRMDMTTKTKAPRAVHIDSTIQAIIIHGLVWEDGACKIVRQLDRKQYEAVNKVLEVCGGKWNKKAKQHLFEGDGETAVREAGITGVYYPENKNPHEFFETPEELVHVMIDKAGSLAGKTVLEPSAGAGAIVRAALAAGASLAWAIELHEGRFRTLQQFAKTLDDPQRLVVFPLDFLTRDVGHTKGSMSGEPFLFDYVLMNPPFSKNQDMKHVRHAYDFLKPGGRLVAIMSPGFTFRSDKFALEFRGWLAINGGTYDFNPDNSFKESGTSVRTVMVVIDKKV